MPDSRQLPGTQGAAKCTACGFPAGWGRFYPVAGKTVQGRGDRIHRKSVGENCGGL